MIRALSLAAALAVLPVSSAVAADSKTSAETAVETAAKTFESRMNAFGERAETIAQDVSLTEAQREARIKTLWAEYAPDVAAFTATVSEQAGAVAASALAAIDIEALVAEAMEDVDIEGEIADALADEDIGDEVARALTGTGIADEAVDQVVAAGMAMAANGAWAQNDPEQAVTYGLVAQYVLDQAARESSDDED
jgi:Spy/CpxP family protein refolding chaperone